MSGDLREQLLAIRTKYGALTPAHVVDEARAEDHPLHDRFEWNDEVAGEKWRRVQAHELIRSVKVSYVDAKGHHSEIRSFHAVRAPSTPSYVYEPVEEVVQDEMATAVLLRDMERQWRELRARFDRFQEFRDMVRRDLGAA